MLLGTLEMEGLGTVMLDNGIWADFDMENCCRGNATNQIKASRKTGVSPTEAGGGACSFPARRPSYLTVGGRGGVVAVGAVGGAVVLQGGQLLFTVTHALFRTLEVLPEFHNLLNETEGEREE